MLFNIRTIVFALLAAASVMAFSSAPEAVDCGKFECDLDEDKGGKF